MDTNFRKIPLVGKSREELEETVTKEGGSKYRASQIYNAIYLKFAKDIESITELPAEFKKVLSEKYSITTAITEDKQVSTDGTMKFLFKFPDGNMSESVLMRFDNRSNLTACISTQVGCPMGCKFCATGKLGYTRNLTATEIAEQIHLIQSNTGLKITNIVFMGQGEPLLNLDNLLEAIEIIRNHFKIGSRRITVSTCGIIPGIKRLTALKFQPTTALSLHAADSRLRESIMPVEKKYKATEVIKELKKLTESSGRRVTIEYVLIKDINDSPKHAKELSELISDLKCNVNLIVFNDTNVKEYKKPTRESVLKFKYITEASGKKVTIRLERGADIDAACGQLSSKQIQKITERE